MQVQDFFTINSIASLAVAASAVAIATNALYKFAHLKKNITAFIFGLIIAYLNVAFKAHPFWGEWILAFLNGCLLYCTALGLNESISTTLTSNENSRKPVTKGISEKEPFFSSWIQRQN